MKIARMEPGMRYHEKKTNFNEVFNFMLDRVTNLKPNKWKTMKFFDVLVFFVHIHCSNNWK